ncbi:MAG: hypothetical protein JWM76_1678 [Pseudonocardiales bacterium]|nr:hypothetical protein [Pseudonocardiales bacterium]
MGAESSISAGGSGGWIGVPKHGVPTAVPDHGRSFILHNPYANERNYLNAFVGQSAIALNGGPGTDSEVAFAVALRRPVVLTGPGWDKAVLELRRPTTARTWLAEKIDGLFPATSSDRAMDTAIARVRQTATSIDEIDVTAIPDLAETARAVDVALERAVPVDLTQLGDLIGYERADQFASWLTSR